MPVPKHKGLGVADWFIIIGLLLCAGLVGLNSLGVIHLEVHEPAPSSDGSNAN